MGVSVWKFGTVAVCAFLVASCAASQGVAKAPQKTPAPRKAPAVTGTKEKAPEKKPVPAPPSKDAATTQARTEVKPVTVKPAAVQPL